MRRLNRPRRRDQCCERNTLSSVTGSAFKFSEGEIKSIDDLLRNVCKARRDGLLIGKSGTVSRLLAAAAPIVDANGRALAAINIICIDAPKNAQAMKQGWGAALVDTARRISIEAQQADELIL